MRPGRKFRRRTLLRTYMRENPRVDPYNGEPHAIVFRRFNVREPFPGFETCTIIGTCVGP
jgi:hypothetical protein